MKNERYKGSVISLVQHIQNSDAIVIGAASGMSAAAGFRHYYEHDKDFINNLGDFEKKYGYFIIGIEPVKNVGHLSQEIFV